MSIPHIQPPDGFFICPEDECCHMQCLLWWNIQAIKNMGKEHDGKKPYHRPCEICDKQKEARSVRPE